MGRKKKETIIEESKIKASKKMTPKESKKPTKEDKPKKERKPRESKVKMEEVAPEGLSIIEQLDSSLIAETPEQFAETAIMPEEAAEIQYEVSELSIFPSLDEVCASVKKFVFGSSAQRAGWEIREKFQDFGYNISVSDEIGGAVQVAFHISANGTSKRVPEEGFFSVKYI